MVLSVLLLESTSLIGFSIADNADNTKEQIALTDIAD